MTRRIFQIFVGACDICNHVSVSNLKRFRMEIRNASATPSKSNQLRNVNTIGWKSRNITTQPGEIDNRKSEVIAFDVNAGMNIPANNFYIQINERSSFVWSICISESPLGLKYIGTFLTLLKYQLTRDTTFALIRSCGHEVYTVEKPKEDT